MQSNAKYISHHRFCVCICVGIIAFLIPVFTVFAQNISEIGGGDVGIVSNPRHPAPLSEVRLSLNDYNTSTIGASTYWFVDGVELVDMRNERSITLTSGALGEETVVRAEMRSATLPTISMTHTIRPIEIDIILEADTYTPNFYKGRALPTPESSVRAFAYVHTGDGTSPDALAYKWKFGETVLSGGPVKGKYQVDITVPRLNGGRLSVEVYTAEGELIGTEYVVVGSVKPLLLFYEYSPLHGLIQKTSSDTLTVSAPNTTLYAEPYFLNTQNITNDATFTWKVRGREVPYFNTQPNVLPLSNISLTSNAVIDVSVLTRSQPPQFTNNTITVSLE